MNSHYLKQKRILLVDDEQELLQLVVSILKEDGFLNIKTAKTVREAITISKTCQPQLAILDVMLPDGSGFDLMKQLKTLGDYPVLFLTARGEDDDKFQGFGLGADDYIIKPFLPKNCCFVSMPFFAEAINRKILSSGCSIVKLILIVQKL